jgi:hypothetical protein
MVPEVARTLGVPAFDFGLAGTLARFFAAAFTACTSCRALANSRQCQRSMMYRKETKALSRSVSSN